jgi:DinB superfamily
MPEHDLHTTVALLRRTPATLDALLRDLPDFWTHRSEGASTWTAVDVVGHLIHADRTDWLPRARWILEHGDTEPFPPFDRRGHFREIDGKPLAAVLDEFARVRASSIDNLLALRLQPVDFDRPGRHPALGTTTLGQLLATWPAHDLTHLHQISRILAHQYRGQVGPWSQFLGVMQCAGHGS